ncbi:type I inositol 1,4,5-trisphosphate 5-phosphatase 1-like [Pyrus ussuriensis x Pyrus communis]|uniref:Type I inositol 1,4,5-trisphosphate 5-phosphatase 1-like n=1 Tax=Pyrus ussuriensis x Pyrus communis TaxID=2448454 RepID=A0A5N5FKF9_9ROSA|nr:type I inositol 1,4,5-trisphosphate 5-phosphatase 1-like [Pyrus ussuriensis x Pyrus communis]
MERSGSYVAGCHWMIWERILSEPKPTGSFESFFFEGQVGVVNVLGIGVVLLRSWLHDQASSQAPHVCIFLYGLVVNIDSNFDGDIRERERDLSSSWSLTRCKPSGRGSKKKDPRGLGPKRILSRMV